MDWAWLSRGFLRHFLLAALVLSDWCGGVAHAALPRPKNNPLLKKKIDLDIIKPEHFKPVWEYLESVYLEDILKYEAKIKHHIVTSQGADLPLSEALKDFISITRLENDLDHVYRILFGF